MSRQYYWRWRWGSCWWPRRPGRRGTGCTRSTPAPPPPRPARATRTWTQLQLRPPIYPSRLSPSLSLSLSVLLTLPREGKGLLQFQFNLRTDKEQFFFPLKTKFILDWVWASHLSPLCAPYCQLEFSTDFVDRMDIWPSHSHQICGTACSHAGLGPTHIPK